MKKAASDISVFEISDAAFFHVDTMTVKRTTYNEPYDLPESR